MWGDLNDIRDPSEKKGGAPFNWNRVHIFNERIYNYHLIEIDNIRVDTLRKVHQWETMIDFLRS